MTNTVFVLPAHIVAACIARRDRCTYRDARGWQPNEAAARHRLVRRPKYSVCGFSKEQTPLITAISTSISAIILCLLCALAECSALYRWQKHVIFFSWSKAEGPVKG